MKHFLVFLLFFSIDVRVKAEESDAPIFLEPQHCLEQSEYCVIKNYAAPKYVLEIGKSKMSLAKDATLVRHSPSDYTLMKGQILVQAEEGLTLNTPYGKIQVEPASDVLIRKGENEYRIIVLTGKSLLKPLGDDVPVEVLAAFENTLSAVKNLKAQVGIPTPALVPETLQSWSALTWLSKKDFLKSVDLFKDEHAQASNQLSLLSREIAMREIESHELKLEKERKTREERMLRERATREQNAKRLLLMDE